MLRFRCIVDLLCRIIRAVAQSHRQRPRAHWWLQGQRRFYRVRRRARRIETPRLARSVRDSGKKSIELGCNRTPCVNGHASPCSTQCGKVSLRRPSFTSEHECICREDISGGNISRPISKYGGPGTFLFLHECFLYAANCWSTYARSATGDDVLDAGYRQLRSKTRAAGRRGTNGRAFSAAEQLSTPIWVRAPLNETTTSSAPTYMSIACVLA